MITLYKRGGYATGCRNCWRPPTASRSIYNVVVKQRSLVRELNRHRSEPQLGGRWRDGQGPPARQSDKRANQLTIESGHRHAFGARPRNQSVQLSSYQTHLTLVIARTVLQRCIGHCSAGYSRMAHRTVAQGFWLRLRRLSQPPAEEMRGGERCQGRDHRAP